MEVECLEHPGAACIGSQQLVGDCAHGWEILATKPWAPIKHGRQAPVTMIKKQNKKKTVIQEVGERKKPLKTLHNHNATAHNRRKSPCMHWPNKAADHNWHISVPVANSVKLHVTAFEFSIRNGTHLTIRRLMRLNVKDVTWYKCGH